MGGRSIPVEIYDGACGETDHSWESNHDGGAVDAP